MAATSRPRRDPLSQLRWAVAANALTVVLCVAVLRFAARRAHWNHWNWALLFWGIAVCVLQLVITELFVATARHFVDTPSRDRHRRRRPLTLVLMLETGVLIGAVAATFDQAWIVVAALVMMLAVNTFAILWAVRLIRRRRRLSQEPG